MGRYVMSGAELDGFCELDAAGLLDADLLDGEDAGFEADGTDDGCAEDVLEFSEGAAEEGTDEA